jgi:ATP-dependent helicase/nuclease subunit A
MVYCKSALDMTDNYLDITKSVMISSPAGSGKTEKLSRRYIALLQNGSDVERILAITFTEKAAAEMKERILKILAAEDPVLFARVRERMPRMRISTIHAFCLKLLKRFCLELDVDPSLEVMDGFNADTLWSEAVYQSLQEDGASGERLFYGVLKDSGIKGWNTLYRMLNELHSMRPKIELGLGKMGMDLDTGGSGRLEILLALYSRCLAKYTAKKRERHSLDYNDLELMAYEAISKNPEWLNVLYSFDEHTDHILVDEFQDTSSLQWLIIDKLTEEWRSGHGAKREAGMSPTIFLVGDDKQSIYSFRGANVDIFRNAGDKLSEWLAGEYHFIEIRENYRSLPVVVDFVNALFGRLMPKGIFNDRRVEYTPFEAVRQGEGAVELTVIEGAGISRDDRRIEAFAAASRIEELHGQYEVYEKDARRACNYGDMAILLRSRTQLAVFEDALRKRGVPFVVIKGIGFYNTPEVAMLRDLLFTLIDPMDDHSLFNVLRSPLFSIGYASLCALIKDSLPHKASMGYLYPLVESAARQESLKEPAQKTLWPVSGDGKLNEAAVSINSWIARSREMPLAVLIEDILGETGTWKYLHEKQRYVNAKKFIKLVAGFESCGLGGTEIREKLIRASEKSDESKANVNTEGMDAVKIMTVHASKGLQFPMVFLPCLDERGGGKSGAVVMDEDGGSMNLAYEDDPEMRRELPVFRRQKEKAEEEEKRLLYVASTRARDYLFMSGVLNRKPTGKLAYLMEAFGMDESDKPGDLPFSVRRLKAAELSDTVFRSGGGPVLKSPKKPERAGFRDEIIHTEPLVKDYRPASVWLDVTEEIEDIRRKHGEDWLVLGRAFHRIFEGISNGSIDIMQPDKRIIDSLRAEICPEASIPRMKDIVMTDIKRLEDSGLMKEIILPQDNSYAELPFVHEHGRRVYKGRIDRVIIRDGVAFIYDYKTYPIREKDIPEILQRYSFQLDIYRRAAERLFSVKAKAYIFFTHEARVVPVG